MKKILEKAGIILSLLLFTVLLSLGSGTVVRGTSLGTAKDGKQGKGREKFMDGFGKQEGNQHPEAADSRGQTKNPQGAEGGFCCVGILTEFRQKLGFSR